MTKPLKVKHSYNAGDLIASLPGLKRIYETTGRPIILYQELDFPAFYYEGAEHPIKNSEGQQVSMNKSTYDMLLYLISKQDYISEFLVWYGEDVDIDFMEARDRRSIPIPFGSIFHWPFLAFPQLSCDVSKPWLTVPESPNKEYLKDKIIINRTSRYTNPYINYYFLKEHQENVLFIGMQEEWKAFDKKYDLSTGFMVYQDFLQYAQAINDCKLFIGNQSFFWNCAHGMGKSSILELCNQFPNCWPFTPNGHGVLYQNALEHLFNRLIN